MDLITLFLIILVPLFCYHFYSIQFKTRKLPPGPFNFPFGLGIIPSSLYYDPFLIIKKRPWEFMNVLSKRYGDFFSVEIGQFYVVVISSFQLLQEVANLEEYSMKISHPTFTYPRTFNKELGVVLQSNPDIWIELRKFTQRTLRDFGFGKRHTMQSAIEAETNELVKAFNEAIKSNNGIIRIRTLFTLSLLNVLWCMVAGQRYEHDDPKLLQLMEKNIAVTKSGTFADPFHVTFKWLEKYFPSIFNEDLRLSVFDECHKFTESLVNERKLDGHYKTSPQNYIDVFLQKIEQDQNNGQSIYTDEQLQAMLADLLQTGTATTNGTLNYGLLFLTLNSDVQKKCQKEIDAIVPKHLTPTVEDIEKMPYFQAFILETHRLANVVPNPVPRLVPKDWKIRGYTIPKGTVILSNHYSVHMENKIWGDPTVFRPDRFINDKGEFVLDKRVIHFGFGKRICIGITLANSVIPIFLATLLQHFNFSVVPGTKPPTTEPETGVSLSPLEFPVYVTSRA